MSCDRCEFECDAVGVRQPDEFAFPKGWIPPSVYERHERLVARRLACVTTRNGVVEPEHVGPFHDWRGRPLDLCPNCFDDTSMHLGGWDTRLDHATCPVCRWSGIGGGHVLRTLRHRNAVSRLRKLGRIPDRPDRHTAPADRGLVEAAFRAYLRRPLPIRWVNSPVEVVNALLDASPDEGALPDGWSMRSAVPVPERDPDPIAMTLGAGLARLSSMWPKGISLTNHEAFWEPAMSPRRVTAVLADSGQFGLQLERTGRRTDVALAHLLEVLRASCGPVVVLHDEVVASERPIVFRTDEQGRLHADDGPAVAYADGTTVYAWHGIAVDSFVIDEPERITVRLIDGTSNAEMRRVLIERMGAERLVREGNAKLVHEDATGRLWRRDIGTDRRSRDEPIVMVEVQNSTLEADGSRKTYFLRVPPNIWNARQGVAWTFGLTSSTYEPAVES